MLMNSALIPEKMELSLFTEMPGETVREGFDQRFERGFVQYKEGEMGREASSGRSGGLCH
jgi:hypothetical protein